MNHNDGVGEMIHIFTLKVLVFYILVHYMMVSKLVWSNYSGISGTCCLCGVDTYILLGWCVCELC